MYSIVLATVLVTTSSEPAWRHHRRGGGGGGACAPVMTGGWCACYGGGMPMSGGYGGCYGSMASGDGGGMGGGGSGGGMGLGGGGTVLSPGGLSGGTAVGAGGPSELEELRREVRELRRDKTKQRVEHLKQTIEELRSGLILEKLNELRREIEELRGGAGAGPRVLPPPLESGEGGPLPELPPPEGSVRLQMLPPPLEGSVRLRVPADATLFVNGWQVPVTPEFLVPALESGKVCSCDFKVVVVRGGKTMTRTRRLTVRSGEVVRLDYDDMTAAPAADEKQGAGARLTVRLPEEARLYVDGAVCPVSSDSRSFETPALRPGMAYCYTLRAEVVRDGRPVSESRRVDFRAGDQVVVNFGHLGTTRTARR